MRLMPHNIEAEQALLGALLVNNHAVERITDTVGADHFYEPIHAAIFKAITVAVSRGQSATPISLKEQFVECDPLGDNLTVPQYLGRLAARATTTVNAKTYAQIVRDLATRRELIVLGETLVNSAYSTTAEASPAQIMEHAEQGLFQLAAAVSKGSHVGMPGAIAQAMEMAHQAYERGGELAGLATGIDDIDRMLGGLGKTDLIVLAGRPAMGKTALATNIAAHIATRESIDPGSGEVARFPVGVFSMEMSADQLATRLLSERTGISSDRIRRGRFDEDQWRAMVHAAQGLARLPIEVDQSGGLTLASLATRARRMKRKYGITLFVIDYLQLMGGGSKRENRNQEITEITIGLKALAKELQTPIVLLSQLSRDVEKRSDKRPQLSDLRDSGSIEQDADVVRFVYRDDYYLSREEPAESDSSKYTEWQTRIANSSGKAEVIVSKNRHGPSGIVHLAFDASLTRFSNLPKEERRRG